jgi:tellurite resistance protein
MTDSQPSRDAALFLQLVLGLQQAAMVALGKLMNPMSGKIERNLEAAKNTIDTIGAIEARTRGNLEADEQRVLAQVLTELRLNYVDELKKGGGPS